MLTIEKKLFPAIFRLPFLNSRTVSSLFFTPRSPAFAFSSLKQEFQTPSNPIIDKEDQPEQDQPQLPPPQKKVAIEYDLYSYETTTPKEDPDDPENPFVYSSKFGPLKLIACPIAAKQLRDMKGIHYFNDKVSTNYLKKILKSDKKCLLLFEPDTHYKNLSDLYKSIERLIRSSYFGNQKRPRNPFSHCKSPKEIFNLNRRILIELKQQMNKIMFMINTDGSVRLKGNFPTVNQLKPALTRQFKDPSDPFIKHDFMVPFNIYKGMASAESLEKSGIPIQALDGKKIYPLYGVWSPTRQGYVDLMADYIEKNPKKMKEVKYAMDLGCGTGVLSMTLAVKAGVKKVYAVDKSLTAVRNTRLNAEIMELGDRVKAETMNLCQPVEDIEKTLEKKKLPKKYDLIVCNPPWIVASFINEKKDLDNGVYDPEEGLLKASFLFASNLLKQFFIINFLLCKSLLTNLNIFFLENHLNKTLTNGQNGLFMLIYSDLSEKLGLQEEGRIRKMCDEHGLLVLEERKKNLLEIESDTASFSENSIDPLYKYKAESKVILYIMTKV